MYQIYCFVFLSENCTVETISFNYKVDDFAVDFYWKEKERHGMRQKGTERERDREKERNTVRKQAHCVSMLIRQ